MATGGGADVDNENLRTLEEKLAAFRAAFPADADWRKNAPKMGVWQPEHVYDWLKTHKEEEIARFADAVGRKMLNGEQLLGLIEDEERACKNPVLVGAGNEVAIRVLCVRVKDAKEAIDARGENVDSNIAMIARDDIMVKSRRLARGGSDVIYFGTYQGQDVAIKTLLESKNVPEGKSVPDVRLHIEREARLLHAAMCPNVLPLVGLNKTDPFLVTEFMPGGTVEEEYLKSRNGDMSSIFHKDNPHNRGVNGELRSPLIQKVRIASKVAAAVAHCHSLAKPIVHLDIAARNVLLDKKKQPKLCDFGLAAYEMDMIRIHRLRQKLLGEGKSWESILEQEQKALTSTKARDPNIDLYRQMVRHQNPPPRWSPPSVFRPNPLYDRKNDTYSFGCFLYELATEDVPYADLRQEAHVLSRKRDANAVHCDLALPEVHTNYDAILRSCLGQDPPSMTVIAQGLEELYLELLRGKQTQKSTIQRLVQGARTNVFTPPSSSSFLSSKLMVVDTVQCSPTSSAHDEKVTVLSVAFEETEQLVFLGTSTGQIRVCCLKNRQALDAPLFKLEVRKTGQVTAMHYSPELQMLLVTIADELICLSLFDGDAPAATRSIQKKITKHQNAPLGLEKVSYPLKKYGIGIKQQVTSLVFIYTEPDYPAYFVSLASSSGVVDLFQIPKNFKRHQDGSKDNAVREFDLIASWKFKAPSLDKIIWKPSTQMLYVRAEEKVFSMSLKSFVPPPPSATTPPEPVVVHTPSRSEPSSTVAPPSSDNSVSSSSAATTPPEPVVVHTPSSSECPAVAPPSSDNSVSSSSVSLPHVVESLAS